MPCGQVEEFAKPNFSPFSSIFRQSIQPYKCKLFISRQAQQKAKGLEFLFLVLRIHEGRIGREDMLDSTGILIIQDGFLISLIITITITVTHHTIHFTREYLNYNTIYLLSSSGILNEARIFRWLCTKKMCCLWLLRSEITVWLILRLDMDIYVPLSSSFNAMDFSVGWYLQRRHIWLF